MATDSGVPGTDKDHGRSHRSTEEDKNPEILEEGEILSESSSKEVEEGDVLEEKGEEKELKGEGALSPSVDKRSGGGESEGEMKDDVVEKEGGDGEMRKGTEGDEGQNKEEAKKESTPSTQKTEGEEEERGRENEKAVDEGQEKQEVESKEGDGEKNSITECTYGDEGEKKAD